jgi:hypothetical protein
VIDYSHYTTSSGPLKQLFARGGQDPGRARCPGGREREVMRLMFQPALDILKREGVACAT